MGSLIEQAFMLDPPNSKGVQRSRKGVSLIRPSTIFRFSSTFSLLSTPQNRFYSLCAAAFNHAISRQNTLNQQLRPKSDIWNNGLDFANFSL